jgi:hypothetical protein
MHMRHCPGGGQIVIALVQLIPLTTHPTGILPHFARFAGVPDLDSLGHILSQAKNESDAWLGSYAYGNADDVTW